MGAEKNLSQLAINTIRTLSMDAVQKAQSGHPGTPMAMAPVIYTLWQKVMQYDPADPIWPNRDRFVLSAGHASMLLYSILHLTQVKSVESDYKKSDKLAVSLDDIKNFRQLDSKCPGHPEYRWTSGVETTTGPLGQGLANSVGMAIGARWMAANFNRPGFQLFNSRIYSLCGDGCMMEGVSSEAASLAGHLKLANLCWIYDSNHITIEGSTDLAFSDDVSTRFQGYGWQVLRVGDANDCERIELALQTFKRTTDRPTLIIVNSHIGYGAPTKQDSAAAHGEPLGEAEIIAAKKFYAWQSPDAFHIPEGVIEHFKQGIGERGSIARKAWLTLLSAYEQQFPQLAQQLLEMQTRELPTGWDDDIPSFPADESGIAGRVASQKVLNAIAKKVPWLMGGSADLAPSTKTALTFAEAGTLTAENPGGRNMHFGVREHAMASIANGLAITKLRSYASTFFTFSDYARPAIRLSALMEIPTIFIFTHDSIGVGEDGPTHQPVEHLASLRAIPNMQVFRPADANEVAECWRVIMKLRLEPASLLLTRQNIPTFDRTALAPASGVAHGAYILADTKDGQPEVILLGTGSEVQICLVAFAQLEQEGIATRVVSMPCWEIFDRQPLSYQEHVLPSAVQARVAVEKASTFGWHRYVGMSGAVVGMNTFGKSAPLDELKKLFGFTPEKVVELAREQVNKVRNDR